MSRSFATEFRRAAFTEALNDPGTTSPETADFSFHKRFDERRQQKPVLFRNRPVRFVRQSVSNVLERFLRAALHWVNGGNYFECDECQEKGKVVCIDGDGFRLLVGRHRLFLLFRDGKQHSFTVPVLVGATDYAVDPPYSAQVWVRPERKVQVAS
jgi:hypothetical protein